MLVISAGVPEESPFTLADIVSNSDTAHCLQKSLHTCESRCQVTPLQGYSTGLVMAGMLFPSQPLDVFEFSISTLII